jgi:hypothetical protein
MADYFSTRLSARPGTNSQMKINKVFHVEHSKHISQRMFHVEHFCGKMARLPL